MCHPRPSVLALLAAAWALATGDLPAAQSQPTTLPDLPWHLTARPWSPVVQPRAEILDKVEAIATRLSAFQYWNAANPTDVRNGEITDPYRGSEWQYATPYFAFAAAVVVSEGRSPALLTAAIRAMDHATADIAHLDAAAEDGGFPNDRHGEFMIAPLAKALGHFETMLAGGQHPALTTAIIQTWRTRLGTPRSLILQYTPNNWRTYAMKGEWRRSVAGLIEKTEAINWIEASWLSDTVQRSRWVRDRDSLGLNPYFLLYHDDDAGGRQNFAYHGGATGNLYDMIAGGYDGPSRADMIAILEHSLKSSLLLMAGNGDAPAAGRTGNHVWNDIVYANNFDTAAETAWTAGRTRLAGQYRRAATLAFRSAWRFQQEPGYFSVTKNLFHPSLNVGYAQWSALTNYNGYAGIHSAEAFLARQTSIPEQPTPSEIGGYTAILDPQFAHVLLNAGGHTLQLCTNGALTSDNMGGQLWHTLGLLRFGRSGWDTRLGPGDGWSFSDLSGAISFSPVFFENGVWKTVAQLPSRYTGVFTPEFTHPLMVRGTLRIAPRSGQTGPAFDLRLTLTPDGTLLDTTRVAGAAPFGLIWPQLAYDGKHVLGTSVGARVAATAFPKVSAGTPVVLQAETSAQTVLAGGATAVATGTANAQGTGYVTFPATGGTATWSGLDGGAGGATAITLRYSLATASTARRSMILRVNGAARPVVFDSTGRIDDWHPITVPVSLAVGTANTIRLESSGESGVNLDEFRLHPVDATQTEPDQQAFIALDASPTLDATTPAIRTPLGDLLPVRVTSGTATQSTFVYPRSGDDPTAETLQAGFTRTAYGFATPLARVAGDLYVGRWAAGGLGSALDLDGNGVNELTFDASCNFVAQHAGGVITAIEADRFVQATVAGRTHALAPHTPLIVPAASATPAWNYRPLAAPASRDELTFTVTPAAFDREFRVGLGKPDVEAPLFLLGGLRFGVDGRITALDAPAGASLAYSAGVAYRVRIVLDVPSGRCSVYVKPAGAPERRLLASAALPEGFVTTADLATVAWFASAGQDAPGEVTGLVVPPITPVVQVNFQTAASATPSGYLADTGAVYGPRGNGQTYGWATENSGYSRDRNAVNSPDQRYDTLNHLSFGVPATMSNTWGLALPAGRYRVRLVCGDPSYSDSYFDVLAEGVSLVKGDAAGNWREATAIITVADGSLTLSNGPSAQRNKLAFIEISTAPVDPYPYETYAAWAGRLFPGGSASLSAAPLQDADRDGAPNLLEYALASDPLAAESTPSAVFARSDDTPARPALRFTPRRAALDEVTYEVQRSTDLVAWETVWTSADDADFSSSAVTLIDAGPGLDMDARVKIPAEAFLSRVFLRLRVSAAYFSGGE